MTEAREAGHAPHRQSSETNIGGSSHSLFPAQTHDAVQSRGLQQGRCDTRIPQARYDHVDDDVSLMSAPGVYGGLWLNRR